MASLKEILTAPDKRRQVIDDCVRLIDAEVASKGGFSGLAVKAAYKTVKAVKPGMIPSAVDDLLDDFADKISPFYEAAKEAGKQPGPAIAAQADEVAEALLSITDARAKRSTSRTVRKAYEKLRPTGKKHTADAMPAVGRLIDTHAS